MWRVPRSRANSSTAGSDVASDGVKLRCEQPRSSAAIAYNELAGNGHLRGLSSSLFSSLHLVGNCDASTGGSVEATFTTITWSSLLSEVNFLRSLCRRSIVALGDSLF